MFYIEKVFDNVQHGRYLNGLHENLHDNGMPVNPNVLLICVSTILDVNSESVIFFRSGIGNFKLNLSKILLYDND